MFRILGGNVQIMSVSADHKSAIYMERKDTEEVKIPMMGGMTTVRVPFVIIRSDH